MSKAQTSMTLKEMVAHYNDLVEQVNDPKYTAVRTFKDKTVAQDRIAVLEEALGETSKAPKKTKAKKATKKADTQAEIDDLLGEPKTAKKAAKKAAKKKDSDDEPKRRGRQPSFEYEPHPDGIAEPREGSLRGDALALLENGCTIEDLETFFEEYRDAKGATWKVSCRYRALEILKLLNVQNGYGFTANDKGVITTVTL